MDSKSAAFSPDAALTVLGDVVTSTLRAGWR